MPLRVLLLLILAAIVLAPAMLMAQDDPISRLMRQSQGSLPAAPPKPVPAPGPGPVIGTKPKGPLPIVMSARIGEHDDRTRLVIELSDPVNLRAFALANPDRVVIDMPEVSWRLGAPPS